VEQELLYQEAVKKGINRDPEVRAKAELYRRVIVAQALLEKELEAAAKKYYEQNPEEFQKLKISHIMVRYQADDKTKGKKKRGRKGEKVRNEKEALKLANEIMERLNKGEDFAKVAKEVSEDVATKNRGGDMGLVARDDKRFAARGYGPLLEESFKMKVGEVKGPIKTEKGYHIITVTRGIEQEPYEDAEKVVLFKIRGDVRNDTLGRLKKEGNVTYAEELEPKTKPAPAPIKPAEIEKAPTEKKAEAKEKAVKKK